MAAWHGCLNTSCPLTSSPVQWPLALVPGAPRCEPPAAPCAPRLPTPAAWQNGPTQHARVGHIRGNGDCLMANGRSKGSKVDSGRDSGGFIALPWSVLDCPAYARLSMHGRALLLEVARQFVRDNNGRLLMSRAYMETRGWKSVDMLTKAKRELLEGGFIFQTVMGHRPNKASWFAITWQTLDRHQSYDAGAVEGFQRGAYRQNMPLKNASLRPPHGTRKAAIVPPHGTETPPTVPPHGPIRGVFASLSVPPHGHHLEMPSVALQTTH